MEWDLLKMSLGLSVDGTGNLLKTVYNFACSHEVFLWAPFLDSPKTALLKTMDLPYTCNAVLSALRYSI